MTAFGSRFAHIGARSPFVAGNSLPAADFAHVRRACALKHCKWDPRLGDQDTLAAFPVFIAEADWAEVSRLAELLAGETLSAESELLERPDLLGRLGLPKALQREFGRLHQEPEPASFARVMRFDFHFTRDGWQVSEINSDVPGGFSEAEGFPALMASGFSGCRTAGRPASCWANQVLAALGAAGEVALLTAPGYMEDFQVAAYLASFLRARGLSARMIVPAQIRWDARRAFVGQIQLAGIFRFYQLEWLAHLPRATGWPHLLSDGLTPVSNPARAALSESKRFPLLWPELCTPPAYLLRLLPESRDPREVGRASDGWVLKGSYSNCGDAVLGRDWVTRLRWHGAWARALLDPTAWVAQRRFDVVPIESPIGPLTHCLGVYVIDGKVAGAYLRLSKARFIDSSALDAALLIASDR